MANDFYRAAAIFDMLQLFGDGEGDAGVSFAGNEKRNRKARGSKLLSSPSLLLAFTSSLFGFFCLSFALTPFSLSSFPPYAPPFFSFFSCLPFYLFFYFFALFFVPLFKLS